MDLSRKQHAQQGLNHHGDGRTSRFLFSTYVSNQAASANAFQALQKHPHCSSVSRYKTNIWLALAATLAFSEQFPKAEIFPRTPEFIPRSGDVSIFQ